MPSALKENNFSSKKTEKKINLSDFKFIFILKTLRVQSKYFF